MPPDVPTVPRESIASRAAAPGSHAPTPNLPRASPQRRRRTPNQSGRAIQDRRPRQHRRTAAAHRASRLRAKAPRTRKTSAGHRRVPLARRAPLRAEAKRDAPRPPLPRTRNERHSSCEPVAQSSRRRGEPQGSRNSLLTPFLARAQKRHHRRRGIVHFGLSALGEHHQLQAQIADGAHEGLGTDALAVFKSRKGGVGGTDDLGDSSWVYPFSLRVFRRNDPSWSRPYTLVHFIAHLPSDINFS